MVGSLPFVLSVNALLAEQDVSLFLGEDLITWLVLAFGGALLFGNLAAILRPPKPRAGEDERLAEAPVGRALVMAGIGLVAAVWALASLLRG